MEILFTALIVLSHFDPYLPKLEHYKTVQDPELVQMYSNACTHMFSQPEFKDFNIQEILQQVLADPNFKMKGKVKENIDVAKVVKLYQDICKTPPVYSALYGMTPVLEEAMNHYVRLVESVNTVKIHKGMRLEQSTQLLAANGQVAAESYQKSGRRKWISIKSLPAHVPKAFVAVEDRRFFEHAGVDEIGIFRALMKGFLFSGRPEGGSTITQQVARNMFLDDSLSLERKLKEILIAEKLEDQLSKEEILELYINLIYFGRNSWGIEKAAESYFGKSANQLTIPETAFLVGIVHGPNLYQTNQTRIEQRTNFVLEKLKEAGVIATATKIQVARDLKFVKPVRTSENNYFRDFVIEQIAKLPNQAALNQGLQIQTTLHPQLQEASETALQEGLVAYENKLDRYYWRGVLGNIAKTLNENSRRIQQNKADAELEKSKAQDSLFGSITAPTDTASQPITATDENTEEANEEVFWSQPLVNFAATHPRPVQKWKISVILDDSDLIGFPDGTQGHLSQRSLLWAMPLRYGDVNFVEQNKNGEYEIVQTPEINGAVVAMNPQTGEILAMVGGFSYLSSPWNRAALGYRQPGSLMKPFTYMAALQAGIQPNTLLEDAPLRFKPRVPGGQAWMPRNYDGTNIGPMPMRWALENSRNVMTAFLMSRVGLDPIRNLMQAFGVYDSPSKEYPVILGSQETTLLNMVKVYAEIANGGRKIEPRFLKPNPHLNGKIPSELMTGTGTAAIPGVDAITLYQTRSLLQGVLARGSGARMKDLSEFVAGKTGTSDEMKDVWFIGFTNNLVVGAYVGYDTPMSLGEKTSGSAVALPIVEKVIKKSFEVYAKPTPFPNPPPGVSLQPTDKKTGQVKSAMDANTILEAYRGAQKVN